MKKLTFKVILLALLASFSYAVYLYIAIFAIKINEHNTDYIAISNLLVTTSSPKIILVGGSNLQFGIDNIKLSSALGMPVLNIGLYKNIGLKYMLDSIQQYINKDDIIIVSPEYDHFFANTYYGKDQLVKILFDKPSEISICYNIHQLINFIIYSPEFASLKITKFLLPNTGNIYNHSTFDEYGVYVRDYQLEKIKFPLHLDITSRSINKIAINDMGKYSRAAVNKGAYFIISFPYIPTETYNKHSVELSSLFKLLSTQSIKYISDPIDHVASISFFYDSPYHLNGVGKIIRTEKVISEIRSSIPMNPQ